MYLQRKSFVFNYYSCERIYRKKNENKYLIFDSTDENKEILKKYSDVWSRIKNKIKAIRSGECDYKKDYMKIKFLMMTYH